MGERSFIRQNIQGVGMRHSHDRTCREMRKDRHLHDGTYREMRRKRHSHDGTYGEMHRGLGIRMAKHTGRCVLRICTGKRVVGKHTKRCVVRTSIRVWENG
jgi:hypothetical protein